MSIRTNETYVIKNHWDTLNDDIFNNICSYLPFEEILHLGASSKSFHYDLSQKDWKHLKSIKYFNFEWSDSPKKSFILCKAIHAYVHNRKANISHEEATEIYNRFESLMIKSPLFGAYLWSDLTHLCPTVASRHYQKFEENLAFLQTPLNNVKCAGDLLLRALYKITCCESEQGNIFFAKLGQISNLCIKAIDAGATCASYFAYKILKQKCNEIWHLSLGSRSQAKGDSRALDHLYNNNDNSATDAYNSGVFLPSVLAAIVKKTPISAFGGNFQVGKDQLKIILDDALEAYGKGNIPQDLLEATDFLLKHYFKGEGYSPFNQYEFYISKGSKTNDAFINSYDGYIDVDYRISNRHFRLGDWKKAEQCLDQLNRSNIHYPLSMWIRKAYTKFNLEKWEEALKLYEGIFTLYKLEDVAEWNGLYLYHLIVNRSPHLTNNIFDVGFFQDFAYINLKLKNRDRALEYYYNTMDKVFKSPNWDYSDEAFNECKQIFDKIIDDISKEKVSIPPESPLFSIQGRIEAHFGNWDKVIASLEPRIDCIDNKALHFEGDTLRLAQAYFKLENWAIAEQHYDSLPHSMEISIVDNYSKDTYADDYAEEVDFYRDHAFIKIKCGKFDAADSICRQRIQVWKERFEDFDEYAKTLCEELSTLCGENLPPFLSKLASEIQDS